MLPIMALENSFTHQCASKNLNQALPMFLSADVRINIEFVMRVSARYHLLVFYLNFMFALHFHH